MKACVLGMGISGQSAAKFLQKRGYTVYGLDKNHENIRLEGISVSSDQEIQGVYDLLVVSPGVSPEHPVIQSAKKNRIEILGEIELGCRYINRPIYAITGTNGKTTVTLLTAHILNQSGIPALALGNVGIPLTSEVIKDEVVVLELSSYQLETMHSKVIDAGVILNITPDHLDRYHSMEEYAKAKIHIKECLKPYANLYVFGNVIKEYGYLFEDFKPMKENIDWLFPICYRRGVSHDTENIMAAFALCKEAGVTEKQFFDGLETFKKPAHRIEFVRRYEEINYFDDSKGTNIDAVIRAVDAMEGGVVLIAGGVDKGSSYTPWLEPFRQKVRCVCLIGEAADKIEREISETVIVKKFKTLEEAVRHASKVASPGENVLLSPGCSSFDMFKNYAHRGEEFKKIVNNL